MRKNSNSQARPIGYGRKQDVEAHVERELDASQLGSVELEHRDPSSSEASGA